MYMWVHICTDSPLEVVFLNDIAVKFNIMLLNKTNLLKQNRNLL